VRALDPSLPELDKRIADVRVLRQKDCQTQTTNATMFFNYRRWDDARPAVRKALASCDEGSQEYRTAKEVADKLPQ
jgi:hypothetical protein